MERIPHNSLFFREVWTTRRVSIFETQCQFIHVLIIWWKKFSGIIWSESNLMERISHPRQVDLIGDMSKKLPLVLVHFSLILRWITDFFEVWRWHDVYRITKWFQFRHVLIIQLKNFPGIICLESKVTETFLNRRRLIYRHFLRSTHFLKNLPHGACTQHVSL